MKLFICTVGIFLCLFVPLFWAVFKANGSLSPSLQFFYGQLFLRYYQITHAMPSHRLWFVLFFWSAAFLEELLVLFFFLLLYVVGLSTMGSRMLVFSTKFSRDVWVSPSEPHTERWMDDYASSRDIFGVALINWQAWIAFYIERQISWTSMAGSWKK